IANAAFSGIVGVMRDAVETRPAPGWSLSTIGSLFGECFQRYICDMLSIGFADSFVQLPVDRPERADGLILFADRIAVVEIKVTRPRFLSVADVEHLPDLAGAHDVGMILADWAVDPATFETSLSTHLASKRIAFERRFMRERLARVFQFLASRIELDPTRISG